MKITVDLNQEDMELALERYILEKFDISLNTWELKIYVKSKQNYKSEWEEVSFKGVLTKEA